MSMLPIDYLYAGSFVAALAAGTLLRLWLTSRQMSAVRAHRDRVPDAFADRVSLAEHQKAADYTLATVRFGRQSVVIDSLVTLALTVGVLIGGIDLLCQHRLGSNLWSGALVILSVVVLTGVIDL